MPETPPPDADWSFAFVPEDKLTRYLLNPAHPVGGPKAAFFYAHGYSVEDPDRLRRDLLAHARTHPVAMRRPTPFGLNVAVDGGIETPRGTTIWIRSVWETHGDAAGPRLVSAYPVRDRLLRP